MTIKSEFVLTKQFLIFPTKSLGESSIKMETRVLVPKGLQIVVVSRSNNSSSKSQSLENSGSEDDNEEKPSSSSGHFETGDGSKDNNRKRARSSSGTSSSLSSPSSSDSEEYSRKIGKGEDLIGSSESRRHSYPTRRKTRLAINNDNKNSSDEEIVVVQTKLEMKSEFKQIVENRDKISDACTVKVCAAREIEKGTLFTPNEGDVQVLHLNGVPALPKDDVSKSSVQLIEF